MSDDDLIRRGDVLALFTATDPNTVPGCRYAEHAQDYCGCAERIAAIRALPAVAREPWPASGKCLRCGTKAHGAMEVCPAPTTMDPPRCDRCGWPLAASESDGCIVGNCSQRPLPPSRTVAEAVQPEPSAGVPEVWSRARVRRAVPRPALEALVTAPAPIRPGRRRGPWHDRRCYFCARGPLTVRTRVFFGSRPPIAVILCDGCMESAQRKSAEWAYCEVPRVVRS